MVAKKPFYSIKENRRKMLTKHTEKDNVFSNTHFNFQHVLLITCII